MRKVLMITAAVLYTALIFFGMLLVCLAIFWALLQCQVSLVLTGAVSVLLSGAAGCCTGDIIVGLWRIVRDELKNGSRF